EPGVPRELLGLPNVVLTPHVGSATAETREAMTRVLVDNLLAVERGGQPLNPVGGNAGERTAYEECQGRSRPARGILARRPRSAVGRAADFESAHASSILTGAI